MTHFNLMTIDFFNLYYFLCHIELSIFDNYRVINNINWSKYVNQFNNEINYQFIINCKAAISFRCINKVREEVMLVETRSSIYEYYSN